MGYRRIKGQTRKPTLAERKAKKEAMQSLIDEGKVPEPKNTKLQAGRRKKRAVKPKRVCPGYNLRGEACGMTPLQAGKKIEDIAVSGEFCLHHDPDITNEIRARHYQRKREDDVEARPGMIRRPWELLAESLAKTPEFLVKPHLEGLGFEWDEESRQFVPKVREDGSPDPGATHIGFSREGVARKSKHRDFALQAKLVNDLNDRIFGKARMALDVAADATLSLPQIPTTADRAREVASVLGEAQAFAADPDGESDPDAE